MPSRDRDPSTPSRKRAKMYDKVTESLKERVEEIKKEIDDGLTSACRSKWIDPPGYDCDGDDVKEPVNIDVGANEDEVIELFGKCGTQLMVSGKLEGGMKISGRRLVSIIGVDKDYPTASGCTAYARYVIPHGYEDGIFVQPLLVFLQISHAHVQLQYVT